jgi:hypothetical protein
MTLKGFESAPSSFSKPAMAVEYERAFSSAEKLIIPERNALANATIGTTECLKAWWDQVDQTRLGGGHSDVGGFNSTLDTIGQSPSTRWYIYILYTSLLIWKVLTSRLTKQGSGTLRPVLYSLLGALISPQP